jgi:hypothetical protein
MAIDGLLGLCGLPKETSEPGDAQQDPSIGRVCPDFTWYLAGSWG